ncbi:MAG: type IV pili twitching motility protein PilT, partial [Planctomycetes bacterium]|nr:type IV pili twitching motility protein PilT [Planctomycetota bacterium]
IVDAFPVEQQEQIRAQLSTALLAVVSQALLPRADGPGVTAAFEIMIVTSAIEHLIRENQTHKITSAIQTGAQQGMILLDDFLYNLFSQKRVTYQVMMAAAQNPADLEQKIKDFTYASAKK